MADTTYSLSKFLAEFGSVYVTTTATDTITAPLERIKLILQTQDVNPDIDASNKFSGVLDASLKMVGNEGSMAYWKGNTAKSIKNLISIALKILFIHRFKHTETLSYLSNKMDSSPGMINDLISSGFSEAIALALVYPFEYAYIMKGSDIDSKSAHRGVFSTIYGTIKSHGVLALYSGLGFSILSIFLHRFCFIRLRKFGEYIFSKSTWHDAIVWQVILAFATSSILSVLRHPLETIKRKLIVQNKNKDPPYKGALECIVQTYHNEGFSGFFSGLAVPLMKIGFATAFVLGMDYALKKELSSFRGMIENILNIF